MLDKGLFLLCFSSALAKQLCYPDASDSYKVRLSINTALGDAAYPWNDNEMFLFRATLAFAMRSHFNGQDFQVSNIVVCEQTPRVSFWFVVTSPLNTSHLVNQENVEEAVRKSRNRINSAFLLNDATLEFVGIAPTLAAPVSVATPPWLIVFGVVMGLVTACMVALMVSSFLQKRRSKKAQRSCDDVVEETQAKTVENGGDGVYNMSFTDDERFTEM